MTRRFSCSLLSLGRLTALNTIQITSATYLLKCALSLFRLTFNVGELLCCGKFTSFPC